MRLDQALNKIGITVIKASKESDGLTLHLRLSLEEQVSTRWRTLMQEFLPIAEDAEQWSADVSKHLRTIGGQIKYNWRITLRGNVRVAQRILTEQVLNSLKAGVDITSFPLVGQKRYEVDAAKGKLMGGHDPRIANSLVSQGLMSGTPGGNT